MAFEISSFFVIFLPFRHFFKKVGDVLTYLLDLHHTVGDCTYSVVGTGKKVDCLPKKQKKHENGARKRRSRRFFYCYTYKLKQRKIETTH